MFPAVERQYSDTWNANNDAGCLANSISTDENRVVVFFNSKLSKMIVLKKIDVANPVVKIFNQLVDGNANR